MQSDLLQGLVLLAVGMTTVFVILSIIVLAGRTLIIVLNRLSHPTSSKQVSSRVDDEDVAVISAVVHHITEGRGSIVTISKPITNNK